MGTKMKGVLKGLRYITQIFEDEKEPEMQIGFPTDVKHLAHIGFDGPSVDNSPSWMKEYKEPEGPQTANDQRKENPNLQCSSQNSSCQRRPMQETNPSRDMPDLPKSSKRNSKADSSSTSSPSRQSRRNSSENSKSTRKKKDSDPGPSPGSESPSRLRLGLPRRSSRKKTKEKESSKSQKNKDIPSSSSYSSPSSPVHDSEILVHNSSLRSNVREGDKG